MVLILHIFVQLHTCYIWCRINIICTNLAYLFIYLFNGLDIISDMACLLVRNVCNRNGKKECEEVYKMSKETLNM